MRSLPRLLAFLCALLVCLLSALPANADSGLKLDAVPVLGPGTPAVDGWGELYVRLENSSPTAISGFIELRLREGRPGSAYTVSRAPFAIAAKGRVNLLLPGHSLVSRIGEAQVVALDAHGESLAEQAMPPVRNLEPLLFDLSTPSRIAPALGSQPVPIRRRTSSSLYGSGSGSTLFVGTPQVNASTGEPVLPDLAAGYASATLVLGTGRTLSALSPAATDALLSWVMGGGALALVLDRPEDLHTPWLEALAGGRVQRSAAPRELSAATQFAVPVAVGGRSGAAASTPHLSFESAKPSAELVATFAGLTGGNLRVSPWGETASYGLGEVHFLAFNPDLELAASDRWAALKMIDLVRHAWDRASVVALPHGEASLEDSRTNDVRRVLDPNENTRWTVVVSTLLLLIYAGLAGPLNFFLAQRAGKPLRALVYLPVWAGLAMISIVIMGILGKGVTGRARHLTLIEAGAGMARASVTRFRGLYGSRADDVTVRAARGSVLDVVGLPEDITRDLIVDRDGLRLERLRQKPWEVQVVREDGFTSLGAGVSLVSGSNGELLIKNRCARDLLGVVVKAPTRGLTYFPKVADGETVSLSKGRSLGAAPSSGSSGSSPLVVANFRSQVEEKISGLGAAWDALETLTSGETDWWPDDVPVLIAQVEGGEGHAQDSGLRVDVDRVLLRVVGYGGVP